MALSPMLLLCILGATVQVAAAESCLSGSYTDVSDNVVSNCVNDNFHLYCDSHSAPITIRLENSTINYDDILHINGSWFGLSCGRNADLLESSITLSCPAPSCTHNACSFVNSGGVEPQTVCRSGNPVKRCPSGVLHVERVEYVRATCLPTGIWNMTNALNVSSLLNGTLAAACSPTHCTEPKYLVATDLATRSDLSLTAPTLESSYGYHTLNCPAGSHLGVSESGSVSIVSGGFMDCYAFYGYSWECYSEFLEFIDFYTPNSKVGCIKPTCPALQFFSRSDAEVLASPGLILIDAIVAVKSGNAFAFECPHGSVLGYASSGVIGTGDYSSIYCTPTGWMTNGLNSTTPALAGKHGCFIISCSTKPNFMTQASVSAFQRVLVDTNQTITSDDGVNIVKCTSGSLFASKRGSILSTSTASLTCNPNGSGDWRLQMDGDDVVYDNHPVGCIRPTCTGLQLFNGREVLLSELDNYYFTQPELEYNATFTLTCPDGFGFGYAETPALFQFAPSMAISCESTGWWVRTSTDSVGLSIPTGRIGCFKRKIPVTPSTTPSPVPCTTTPISLTATLLDSFDGVALHESVQPTTVGTVKRFQCPEGTWFAFTSGSTLNVHDWYMECASNGWRIKDANGRDQPYTNVPVGCVKPSCSDLSFFMGSEQVMRHFDARQLLPTTFSYTPNIGFKFACPVNSTMLIESGEEFSWDSSLSLTCGTEGWMTSAGVPFTANRVGCFNILSICPPREQITQSMLAPERGVIVEAPLIAVAGMDQQIYCRDNAFFAYYLLGTVDAYYEGASFCDGTNDVGWTDNYLNRPIGCVRPACPDLNFYDGTESLLIDLPQFHLINATVTFLNGLFELLCPPGYTIGHEHPQTGFELEYYMRIRCEGSEWKAIFSDMEWPKPMPEKLGCFKQEFIPTTNCPTLKYLEASDVTHSGLVVDTTQRVQPIGTYSVNNYMECPRNQMLALIVDNQLTTYNAFLQCTDSTEGWHLIDTEDVYEDFGPLGDDLPLVGCIKPSCELNTFHGTESVLRRYPTKKIKETSPKFAIIQQFVFECSSDSIFGYQTDEDTIIFNSTMSIRCQREGWHDIRSTTKVGCFETIEPSSFIPDVEFMEYNETIMKQYPDYVWTDDAELAYINDDFSIVCKSGDSYLAFQGIDSKIFVLPDSSIFFEHIEFMFTSYSNSDGFMLPPGKIACLKYLECTPLTFFNGDESVLTSYPKFQFVGGALKSENGVVRVTCVEGDHMGYSPNSTTIFFDHSFSVICEDDGWKVRSADDPVGQPLSAMKIGCFKEAFVPSTNCPALTFITPSHLSSYPGVAVDTNRRVDTHFGINSIDCTSFAFILDGILHTRQWSIWCNHKEDGGWSLYDQSLYPPTLAAVYDDRPVGCIKPNCPDLQLLKQNDAVIKLNSTLNLYDHYQPLMRDDYKFEYLCDTWLVIGYQSSATTITLNKTLKIVCEEHRWTDIPEGAKVGCFTPLS